VTLTTCDVDPSYQHETETSELNVAVVQAFTAEDI
jgi:hypothetical protein